MQHNHGRSSGLKRAIRSVTNSSRSWNTVVVFPLVKLQRFHGHVMC